MLCGKNDGKLYSMGARFIFFIKKVTRSFDFNGVQMEPLLIFFGHWLDAIFHVERKRKEDTVLPMILL